MTATAESPTPIPSVAARKIEVIPSSTDFVWSNIVSPVIPNWIDPIVARAPTQKIITAATNPSPIFKLFSLPFEAFSWSQSENLRTRSSIWSPSPTTPPHTSDKIISKLFGIWIAPLIPTKNTQSANPCMICCAKRSEIIWRKNTPASAPTTMATPLINIITRKTPSFYTSKWRNFSPFTIPQTNFADLQKDSFRPLQFRVYVLRSTLPQLPLRSHTLLDDSC